MDTRQSWSTRAHLLVLVWVAMLPALGFLLMTGHRRLRETTHKAESQILDVVMDLGEMQERLVDGTHQMLSTLATLPEVRRRDAEACQQLFQELLAQNPRLSLILAADPQGQVFAAGIPIHGVSVADRRYFQGAAWGRAFSAGEYVVGRISGKPTLHFSVPAEDAAKALRAVVIAGIDLTGMDASFTRQGLPADSTLTLLDHRGVVLHLVGNGASLKGQPFAPESFRRITGPRPSGVLTEKDAQGRRVMVAYHQLRIEGAEDPYMVIRLAIPEAAALQSSRADLQWNLALLGSAAGLASLVAWFLGGRILVRPLKALAQEAARLQRGEPLGETATGGSRETAHLGRAFTAMAQELEAREARLRHSEETYRLIFSRAPLGILHLSPSGTVERANPTFLSILGVASETLEGLDLSQAVRSPKAAQAIQKALAGGLGAFEGSLRVAGQERTAEVRMITFGLTTEGGVPRGAVCLVEDLSDRVAAAETLKAQQQLLEAFFSQSLDGFYIATLDAPLRWDAATDQDAALEFALDHTRITKVNAAMLEQYGVAESDFLGKTIRSFYLHDEAFARQMMREFLSVGHRHFETFERRADGAPIWIEGDYVSLYDAEGRHTGHFGVQRDITARKAAEAALRSAEEEVRNLFDAVNDAIFVHDLDTGTILLTNRRASEMYGYTPEEMRRLPVEALSSGIPPYSQEEALGWIRRAAAEGPQLFEWQAKDQSGRPFWVEVSMRTADISGTRRMLVVVRDITQRKEAEEALREREELFRLLFERSGDPNLLLDGDRFVDCNPRTVEFLRAATRDAVLQAHPWDLSPPRQPDGEGSAEKAGEMIALARTKGYHRFEWMHRRMDGTDVPVEVLLTAVPWQGKWILHTAWRDLTDRQRAEQERLSLEAQVLQAQKLESLGILAGGIAHDFNNLLSAILGNINLVQASLEDGEDPARFLASAERTVLRASELTKQMLAYSGRGRFVVARLDLSAVVQEMVHLLKVSVSKKVAMDLHLVAGLPPVEAEVAQIQQVVMNLVTNASEAIGDAPGTIALSTGVTALDAAALSELVPPMERSPGTFVTLTVRDTGVGMAPETLARMFDPFFTTKRTGRGLGLSAMLGILRGHRGGLRVESAPGEGSTFVLYFPASTGEVERPEAALPASDLPEGLRILLVDDEPDVRDTAAALLRSFGAQVEAAQDGAEALARVAEGSFDLVLMDITMPRMDGREAFVEMQRIHPGLRVLLSSGYDEGESLQDLLAKGLAGFIAKPYRRPELRAALQAALHPRP